MRFDIGGTIVLAYILTAFDMCFSFISLGMYWIVLLMAFSVITGVFLYVQIEHTAMSPITPLWIMKKPITTILILNFFNFMQQNAISFVFPLLMTTMGY